MSENKGKPIWLFAVAVFIVLVAATVPIWYPRLVWGTPRNQHIDSRMVEHRVKLGMTRSQAFAVLGLKVADLRGCSRKRRNGETEIEIVGSAPPFCVLRTGNHSITLWFDRKGRVTGGMGTWWDGDNTDEESLQLEQ